MYLVVDEAWFRDRNVELVVRNAVNVAHAEQLTLSSSTTSMQLSPRSAFISSYTRDVKLIFSITDNWFLKTNYITDN